MTAESPGLSPARVKLAAILGVLLVSSGLRLWHLDLTPFGIDEAALVRLAEDFVRLGRVPLSGPLTSIGIPSAAHFVYAIAPVVAISRDPAVVAGGIAVANIAGVAGTLWLGWRWFGPPAGLIAATLFATSPWAVSAARWIWQPNLLPPLAVLLFVALEFGVFGRRAWWAAATVPIVVFGALVHPTFALLSPLVLASLLTMVITRRFVPLLVSLGVTALIAAPFVAHEIETRWVDIPNYRYYASLNTFVDLDSARYALALATGLGAPAAGGALPLQHVVPGWLLQATAVLETVLFAGSLAIVVATLANARSAGLARAAGMRLAGLLLWLFLPVVLTIRHSFPIQVHYLLPIYPAPFLLIGAASRFVPRPVQLALFGAVTATGLVQAIADASAIQHLAVSDDICYGTPLRTASAVADEVISLGTQETSRHTSIELNAADALPIAYLVRGAVPEVDLAGEGNLGLGQPSTSMTPHREPPRTLIAAGPADLRYANGVRLVTVSYATAADVNQLIHFAIMWTTGTQAAPNRPLVWDVALHDEQDRVIFDRSGVDHLPGSTTDTPIVSWFSIDAPMELDAPLRPGAYRLSVQLIDAFDSRPIPFNPLSSSTAWNLGPIAVGERQRCT